MAASKKTGSTTSGRVTLAEEDRRYLTETLEGAKAKIGSVADSVSESALFEALERFGLTSERVERLRGAFDDLDVKESVEKASEYLSEQISNARDYAKDNPRKVIGGAAGVLVGASLLAIALRKASNEKKKKRSAAASSAAASTKSAASKKSASKSPAKKSSKKR
ncbi:MAG: hypothetical protein JJE51_12905 [Thermoanaerobaculia bacterium]|nr:hypothetical protein [Thermoanaerobaculia bacterium]